MRPAPVTALVFLLVACNDPGVDSHEPWAASTPPSTAATGAEPDPRPLRRCFPDRPLWEEAPHDQLLERGQHLLDDGDHATALACAEEAAHQAPRSAEAHEDRAMALAALGRGDEARDAMTLALAVAPDDAYTLETAADLYLNRLPPSTDRTTIGLEYARRATRQAKRTDKERRAGLALLEGQALNDLGRADEALVRLDTALALRPDHLETQYERGVALFDLCRFDEARRALERVVAADATHAHAHHHLGLVAERAGDDADAERAFAEARRLDPDAFPLPPAVSPEDFARRLQAAVAALPEDVRRELATVPVEAAELPLLDDLVGEQPPLAPTILGLYRGLPLGTNAPCETPPRAIVLYRRNLLRTVTDIAGLDRAIVRTLWHEIGHVHGEDDATLRDRGLE